MTKLKNIHPGEILLEEFLVPMDISQNALARGIAVPPRRINEIVLGKRAISADTALRLARYFGTSEQFWMGLQSDYDLEEARKQLGRKIDAIERVAARLFLDQAGGSPAAGHLSCAAKKGNPKKAALMSRPFHGSPCAACLDVATAELDLARHTKRASLRD